MPYPLTFEIYFQLTPNLVGRLSNSKAYSKYPMTLAHCPTFDDVSNIFDRNNRFTKKSRFFALSLSFEQNDTSEHVKFWIESYSIVKIIIVVLKHYYYSPRNVDFEIPIFTKLMWPIEKVGVAWQTRTPHFAFSIKILQIGMKTD